MAKGTIAPRNAAGKANNKRLPMKESKKSLKVAVLNAWVANGKINEARNGIMPIKRPAVNENM